MNILLHYECEFSRYRDGLMTGDIRYLCMQTAFKSTIFFILNNCHLALKFSAQLISTVEYLRQKTNQTDCIQTGANVHMQMYCTVGVEKERLCCCITLEVGFSNAYDAPNSPGSNRSNFGKTGPMGRTVGLDNYRGGGG